MGLVVANLCIDGPYVPWALPQKRLKATASMLRFIDFATVIGARTIRVDFCPWGTGGEMTTEAFDIIVERYREYAEICYAGA